MFGLQILPLVDISLGGGHPVVQFHYYTVFVENMKNHLNWHHQSHLASLIIPHLPKLLLHFPISVLNLFKAT